jgi:putative endonuclease
MKTGYVYILGSVSGTLYIGVTSNLEARIWQHREHHFRKSFTKRYQVTKLLHLEEFSRMDDAIAREKQLKGWSRAKKLELIRATNPRWNDLAWDWFGTDGDDPPEALA